MDRLPRQFCTFTGQRIAYVVAGRGPAVVLLHGLGGTADFWQPLIAALAPHVTLIVPDLLGFGASDKPPSGYTLDRHVGAVAAVLQATAIGQPYALVGHSCGCVIAMALVAAGRCPQRLVLAAAPYPSPRFPVRQELLHHARDRLMLAWTPVAEAVHHTVMLLWPLLRHWPVPPELRGARAGYMDHTVASYVGTAESCLFQANVEPFLPALRRVPTLLLSGDADQTIPAIHGARLRAALPHSRFCMVHGGHYAVVQAGLVPLTAWLQHPLP